MFTSAVSVANVLDLTSEYVLYIYYYQANIIYMFNTEEVLLCLLLMVCAAMLI